MSFSHCGNEYFICVPCEAETMSMNLKRFTCPLLTVKKNKAVPLHAMEALGGEEV
jgi:hypothetical protein